MNHKFVLLAPVLASALIQARAATLLSEDFESLPLGPYVSPTETGGDGTDWTATAPAGWVKDQGATPVGNPVEFFGWNAHDRTSWIATEGNQDRANWTGGSGTIMVADSDAYDDGTEIDPALYNVFITTPPIPLTGAVGPVINLNFASSFRAEVTQIATLDYTTDGTVFTRLLTYDSNDTTNFPDGASFNDPVAVQVPNSGAGFVQFRFGLTNASNDWWWAIDNVVVTDSIPEPTTALLAALPLVGLLRRRR